MPTPLIALLLIALSFTLQAAPNHEAEPSAISGLTAADIAALQQGHGWGLAKPAELHGYPGPRHVLELAPALQLDPSQQRRLEQLFQRMQTQAIALGQRYLQTERDLDAAFRQQQIDPQRLRHLIEASATALSALRYLHLNTHLETLPLLSPQQVAHYNQLRGYSSPESPPHQHH